MSSVDCLTAVEQYGSGASRIPAASCAGCVCQDWHHGKAERALSFPPGALHQPCFSFSIWSPTTPGLIQQSLIVLIFMKQKCCHKRVLIVAGCSRSRAVAQQLDLLPLGAFYITPLRLSARMGYARSAFHSFLFSFFLSPSLNFFNQKDFLLVLWKNKHNTPLRVL